jgi:HPt (histidine-containing phosphotransfer) domain-containing protein
VTDLDASDDPLADVLDAKVFNDLSRTMVSRPEALANIYRMFLSNTCKLIDTLRNQEGAARQHTFHAMKGSAAMLGAKRLSALAARLQHEDLHSPAAFAEALEELTCELELFRRVITDRVRLEP